MIDHDCKYRSDPRRNQHSVVWKHNFVLYKFNRDTQILRRPNRFILPTNRNESYIVEMFEYCERNRLFCRLIVDAIKSFLFTSASEDASLSVTSLYTALFVLATLFVLFLLALNYVTTSHFYFTR
jgi:hypothetical protein